MRFPRRQFLSLAASAAALPAMSRIAGAQSYPSRPVRLIVGFPAGGSTDIAARLIGQWLSERLGQPFVVENRPGAGTNIATEAVAKSAADGHTLLFATVANAISASLYEKLNFNFIRDIAPVAGVMRYPNVIEVNVAFPARSIPEFIAYLKANPGKINMASSGVGTSNHLSGELFKLMTGTDMLHVPYRGPVLAMTDVFSGRVEVMFDSLSSSIEQIRAGKLRALAVTTAERSPAFPDLPTVAESVPGYEASGWFGVGVPTGTPVEIIDRLNREINVGLADSMIMTRLADLGSAPLVLSPADFKKLIADETEKWAKVIRAYNIKAE